MNANGMILVLLALGSFFVFRRFSRAGSGPSQKCQARLKRIRNASFEPDAGLCGAYGHFYRLDHGRGPENSGGTGIDGLTARKTEPNDVMKNFQNQAKIVKVSKVIRHILFAGLVLWAIGIPVVLFQAIALWYNSTIPATHYLLWGLALLLGFRFIVNLKLFRFFDRLKDGHLFDAKTVGHLDAAGKWWIVLWLFDVLFHEIRRGVFQIPDYGDPTGLGIWNVWNIYNFGSLFVGLVLMFVAWLLKEAQGLQEEQELTV
jgi:hypothetical protein